MASTASFLNQNFSFHGVNLSQAPISKTAPCLRRQMLPFCKECGHFLKESPLTMNDNSRVKFHALSKCAKLTSVYKPQESEKLLNRSSLAGTPSTHRFRRLLKATSGRGPDGGFHGSSIVQQEAASIFSLFSELSRMQPKYFGFDTAGKKIFADMMEQLVEKLRIFTTRYRLSSDPEAKEILRQLDAQLLEGGFTVTTLYEQLQGTLKAMRADIEQEEAGGPELAAQRARARAAEVEAGMPVMADVAEMIRSDPEFREMVEDPRVMGLVQEALKNPSILANPSVAGDPKVAKFLLKFFSRARGAQNPSGPK